jgi:beta-phosphoglucomutase-like phosphatase (HAD superfamily)
MAPWLTAQERIRYSEYKESLYREACKAKGKTLRLVPGTEEFLEYLRLHGIPFVLASASIKSNIDFFFEAFGLDRWFRKEDVVYDDGSYPDKGAMHLEAARRLNVDISECLLIEDSPTSVRLAKQNGAGCIVAIGETTDPAELTNLGADHYIRNFQEFDCTWLSK